MSVKKAPLIPIETMPNLIVAEALKIDSKIEKDHAKKNAKVKLSKEVLAKMIKDKIEEDGSLASVYDEHPRQAVIVAMTEKIGEDNNLKIGDKVAYRIDNNVGIPIIFHKKRYIGLYPHDILFRYLTSEV